MPLVWEFSAVRNDFFSKTSSPNDFSINFLDRVSRKCILNLKIFILKVTALRTHFVQLMSAGFPSIFRIYLWIVWSVSFIITTGLKWIFIYFMHWNAKRKMRFFFSCSVRAHFYDHLGLFKWWVPYFICLNFVEMFHLLRHVISVWKCPLLHKHFLENLIRNISIWIVFNE